MYININFSCSADHEQDWHPYPFDPHYCYMRMTQSSSLSYSHMIGFNVFPKSSCIATSSDMNSSSNLQEEERRLLMPEKIVAGSMME